MDMALIACRKAEFIEFTATCLTAATIQTLIVIHIMAAKAYRYVMSGSDLNLSMSGPCRMVTVKAVQLIASITARVIARKIADGLQTKSKQEIPQEIFAMKKLLHR
ncbi:hypothetical protein C5E18_11880 [Pectobacterium parmentieri]|nr:hypothetical protein C5E18_11880 [Pectobacterium parmentieri]